MKDRANSHMITCAAACLPVYLFSSEESADLKGRHQAAAVCFHKRIVCSYRVCTTALVVHTMFPQQYCLFIPCFLNGTVSYVSTTVLAVHIIVLLCFHNRIGPPYHVSYVSTTVLVLRTMFPMFPQQYWSSVPCFLCFHNSIGGPYHVSYVSTTVLVLSTMFLQHYCSLRLWLHIDECSCINHHISLVEDQVGSCTYPRLQQWAVDMLRL